MEPESAPDNPSLAAPAKQSGIKPPKPAERELVIRLLAEGKSIPEAAQIAGVHFSSAYRWAKKHAAQQAKESASALGVNDLSGLTPRELLQRLATDQNVLPGYRINAAAALLRTDSGAKEERIIPASVLDWLQERRNKRLAGK